MNSLREHIQIHTAMLELQVLLFLIQHYWQPKGCERKGQEKPSLPVLLTSTYSPFNFSNRASPQSLLLGSYTRNHPENGSCYETHIQEQVFKPNEPSFDLYLNSYSTTYLYDTASRRQILKCRLCNTIL